jgi:hypothetical protein
VDIVRAKMAQKKSSVRAGGNGDRRGRPVNIGVQGSRSGHPGRITENLDPQVTGDAERTDNGIALDGSIGSDRYRTIAAHIAVAACRGHIAGAHGGVATVNFGIVHLQRFQSRKQSTGVSFHHGNGAGRKVGRIGADHGSKKQVQRVPGETVTLAGDADGIGGTFTVNGLISLNEGTYLLDGGTIANSTINLGSSASDGVLSADGNINFTLGSTMTVRGSGDIRSDAFIGGDAAIINQGTITADLAGRALEIFPDQFTNQGLVQTSGGGNE